MRQRVDTARSGRVVRTTGRSTPRVRCNLRSCACPIWTLTPAPFSACSVARPLRAEPSAPQQLRACVSYIASTPLVTSKGAMSVLAEGSRPDGRRAFPIRLQVALTCAHGGVTAGRVRGSSAQGSRGGAGRRTAARRRHRRAGCAARSDHIADDPPCRHAMARSACCAPLLPVQIRGAEAASSSCCSWPAAAVARGGAPHRERALRCGPPDASVRGQHAMPVPPQAHAVLRIACRCGALAQA
jgi:hypothetical protein